jgi:putative endonuclease
MTGLLFCYHIGMKYYVYILRCTDGTLYTGFSTDPEKRLQTHNTGKGAKYTRSRRPCSLVYTEAFDDRREALSREWHIKHELSHAEKEKLINERK